MRSGPDHRAKVGAAAKAAANCRLGERAKLAQRPGNTRSGSPPIAIAALAEPPVASDIVRGDPCE